MQRQNIKFRDEIFQILVWAVATPVLAVWVALSFLPISSVVGSWGEPVSVFIALAFFSTGAFGLLSLFLGYRLLLWSDAVTPAAPLKTRSNRVALISAYALLWMLVYALYSMG